LPLSDEPSEWLQYIYINQYQSSVTWQFSHQAIEVLNYFILEINLQCSNCRKGILNPYLYYALNNESCMAKFQAIICHRSFVDGHLVQ
jgi:hypothetical protein